MDEKQVQEQKKKDMEAFENDIQSVAKTLPNHIKKEFTFNTLEQRMLAQLQTIMALAQLQQEGIINEYSLKRVGIEPSPLVSVRYSIGLGRFVVFAPKVKKPEEVKAK